jgi:tetratricopeptide (TPR) repeat protein
MPPHETDAKSQGSQEVLKTWTEAMAASERDAAAQTAAERGAAAPTPAAETTAAPPPRRRKLLRLVLPLAFLGLGTAAGATWVATRPKPEKPPAVEIHPVAAFPPSAPVASRIDILVRAGCYDEALALCRSEPRTESGEENRSLDYCEALCLEALGQWEKADAAYRRSEKPEGDAAAWARATLGRARCAAGEGDLHAARQLLDSVSVRSGHPHCRGRHVLEECVHFRARVALLEHTAHAGHGPDPLDAAALAWPSLVIPSEEWLWWMPTGEISEPPGPAKPHEHEPVGHHDDAHAEIGEVLVTAHLPEAPVAVLLRSVAASAHLKLHVDGGTETRLMKLLGRLEVESAPLEEVLAALLGGAEVAWEIHGKTLSVHGTESAGHDHHKSIAPLLDRALAIAPEHPGAKTLRVARANLDAEAGRVRQAALAYREFLDRCSLAKESLHAAYNLGLLELRQGFGTAARPWLLEVIDRDQPHGHWAELAWWWVGRTHLDNGDTTEARAAFRAALHGHTKAVKSAAALGLCACDLLDGDDKAALAVLHANRFGPDESHTALAELFEAFARYRVSPSESREEALLEHLLAGRHARAVGPAGVLLAGVAYREVGKVDQMVGLYEGVAESVRGPFAARMTFAVAERYDQLGENAKARQRYLVVAATDRDGLGPLAEFRVADLAFRDGRAAECVRRCRDALGRPGVERDEVLSLLGRAYERLGQYRAAATCFAGQVPAE